MVTLRVRSMVWFATGVVLTLLATVLVMQTWRVDAAPGDKDSTFVPVAPCRLFDMRPDATPSGGKKSPLGAGEGNVHVQQVTGNVGNCVGIPTNATAVSMNMTIVGPTAQSNLRVYPANVATPTVSNLNWLPGQSPTPNKVDVKLSGDGRIKLYNHAGTVSVLADVVGYYTNSTLQELANGLTTANKKIAALEIAQPFAVMDHNPFASSIPVNTTKVLASTEITAPVDGKVIVSYSMYGLNPTAAVTCEVNSSTEISGLGNPDAPGGLNGVGNFAGTSVFDIEAGQSVTYVLACSDPFNDKANAFSPTITAIFTPAP